MRAWDKRCPRMDAVIRERQLKWQTLKVSDKAVCLDTVSGQNPSDKWHHINNLTSELWASPVWLDIYARLLLLLSELHIHTFNKILRRYMHIYRINRHTLNCLLNFFHISIALYLVPYQWVTLNVTSVMTDELGSRLERPVHFDCNETSQCTMTRGDCIQLNFMITAWG